MRDAQSKNRVLRSGWPRHSSVNGAGQAEPIEDFYRGKTLRMLIGYAGGGYDIYGRWSPSFCPILAGKPTIIAQNMPGRKLAAASYIHDVAQGRHVFGSLARPGARQHDQHQCKVDGRRCRISAA